LLNGVRVRQQACIETLNGHELTVSNDFNHPETAHTARSVITAGPDFGVTLPGTFCVG
jgi:hypothetical protein